MSNYIRYAAATVVLGLAGVVISGANVFGTERNIIKFHQPPAELHTLDLGAAGHSDGDILFFKAALVAETGRNAVLEGYLTTIGEANAKDHVEDRFSHMIIDFGKGSTIIVEGRSAYTDVDTEMVKNVPRLRAVVGGTGDYIGARGQISTVRNDDNSYDHSIELVP